MNAIGITDSGGVTVLKKLMQELTASKQDEKFLFLFNENEHISRIIETYKKNVNFLRYQIIFFYFFLALFQYLSIILINNLNFFSGMQVDYFFSLVIGVVIGNILSRKVNNLQFKMIIFLLAFLSSIFLLIEA